MIALKIQLVHSDIITIYRTMFTLEYDAVNRIPNYFTVP